MIIATFHWRQTFNIIIFILLQIKLIQKSNHLSNLIKKEEFISQLNNMLQLSK